jgi:hypothetical protein
MIMTWLPPIALASQRPNPALYFQSISAPIEDP